MDSCDTKTITLSEDKGHGKNIFEKGKQSETGLLLYRHRVLEFAWRVSIINRSTLFSPVCIDPVKVLPKWTEMENW